MRGELSDKQIELIKTILRADKRVELIPTKAGVRIYVCQRKEIEISKS